MYEVSETFLEKLNGHEIQKIRGKIVMKSGAELILDDRNLIGSPKYEKQCVENPENFMFGQLYTGTVEVILNEPDIMREELRGGTLTLKFGLFGLDEWIPLGVWTIDSPERAGKRLIVRGSDCMSRLNVPIEDKFVGAVGLESGMQKVTRLTGIEFAQTPQEIENLVGWSVFGSEYPPTCRDEIVMISQLIGGFAFANREGKIEFRRFGNDTGLTVTAKQRFSAKLSEYTFGVRGVGYADKYGQTGHYRWTSENPVNTETELIISENRYIWDNYSTENPDGTYKPWLEQIAVGLKEIPDWVSGEIQIYGNPCLDLGDMIHVQGGINGDISTNFLITSDYWQFRSPQTLISAGVPESLTTGSNSGNFSQSTVSVNVSKTLNLIEMQTVTGEISGLKEVANACFTAKNQTFCFVGITAEFTHTANTVTKFHVLLDGIKQTVQAVNSSENSRISTVNLTVPLSVGKGSHKVTAEVFGNIVLDRLNAWVCGQDIAEFSAQNTDSNDYIFHSSQDGKITVDKYIGISKVPEIPQKINGQTVTVIGSSAFVDSEVTYAEISEGAEEIQ